MSGIWEISISFQDTMVDKPKINASMMLTDEVIVQTRLPLSYVICDLIEKEIKIMRKMFLEGPANE
jgi:hypothetical protein